MSSKPLIVSRVLGVLREIYERHKMCQYAALNDIAVIVYGLVKPVEEVRVLVDPTCSEEILYTLLRAFNIEEHYVEALERLKEQKVVAVSTRFYPPVVVELARSNLDKELLQSAVDIDVDGIYIRIPKLEHLIAKLLSTGLYPYTAYAYALTVAWIKRLNIKEFIEVLLRSDIDIGRLADKLEGMYILSRALPQVRDEFEKAMTLIRELKSKKS